MYSALSTTARLNLFINEWTEIDLKSLQGWLDSKVAQLHNGRQRIKDSHEGLILKIKQFRELSKEERLKNIGGVMRKYQNRIDDLLALVQENEAVFQKLYNTLGSAADPINVLRTASAELSKRGDAVQELEQAKRDLGRMGDKVLGLTNQSITVQELEYQIRELRGTVESDISVGIEKLKSELEEEMEKTAIESKLREGECISQVQFLKEELAQIKKRLNESQVQPRDHSLKKDQTLTQGDRGRQVLWEDSRLLNSRVVSLMRENQELQSKLKILRENTVSTTQLELKEKKTYAKSRAKKAGASLQSQETAKNEILKDRKRAALEQKVRDRPEHLHPSQLHTTPLFDQKAWLKKKNQGEQRWLMEDLKRQQSELGGQTALLMKVEEGKLPNTLEVGKNNEKGAKWRERSSEGQRSKGGRPKVELLGSKTIPIPKSCNNASLLRKRTQVIQVETERQDQRSGKKIRNNKNNNKGRKWNKRWPTLAVSKRNYRRSSWRKSNTRFFKRPQRNTPFCNQFPTYDLDSKNLEELKLLEVEYTFLTKFVATRRERLLNRQRRL